VRQVHELLMVDEDFTLWHEDGFTWWPHRLAQRFRCEGPVEVDGVPTWWIGFETDCLRGVDPDADAAQAFVCAHNRLLNVGAFVLDGERLTLRARLAVRPDTVRHSAAILTEIAALANVFSHRHEWAIGNGLAEVMASPDLVLDVSAHPVAGERRVPHGLLGVVDHYEAHRDGSRIDPTRLPDLREGVHVGLLQGGSVMGGTREGWVACRFAWGAEGLRSLPPGGVTSAAFAEVAPQVELRIDRGGCNPVLGPGTLVRVTVPVPDGWSTRQGVRWANELNRAELATRWPLRSTGGWVWTPGQGRQPDTCTWASFFADLSARPRLAGEEMVAAKARADWYVTGPGLSLRPGGRPVVAN
jgi:hypothetical protein